MEIGRIYPMEIDKSVSRMQTPSGQLHIQMPPLERRDQRLPGHLCRQRHRLPSATRHSRHRRLRWEILILGQSETVCKVIEKVSVLSDLDWVDLDLGNSLAAWPLPTAKAGRWNFSNPSQPNPGPRHTGSPCRSQLHNHS